MSQPAIEIVGLEKSYTRGGERLPVLAGIDLTVPAGEFLALMGPSGSGKSTLLHLIAGLDQPTAGRICVAGQDISRFTERQLADWRARQVGFVFQFYNLMPVLSALENVELPLLLTALSAKERREHALAALDMVGLSHRLQHRPNELSGGQQQRVAIARALVSDPALIVADEPTGDLDKQSAQDVLGLLSLLNTRLGKTIVMVTHDARAAEAAHTIRQLDKGVLLPA